MVEHAMFSMNNVFTLVGVTEELDSFQDMRIKVVFHGRRRVYQTLTIIEWKTSVDRQYALGFAAASG
jgi:PBP1b-binding outer membrane lipoprotein LpoB